jgi:hypothetical protein
MKTFAPLQFEETKELRSLTYYLENFQMFGTFKTLIITIITTTMKYVGYVKFQVFMAVTMKNSVFLDVMSCCGSCKN